MGRDYHSMLTSTILLQVEQAKLQFNKITLKLSKQYLRKQKYFIPKMGKKAYSTHSDSSPPPLYKYFGIHLSQTTKRIVNILPAIEPLAIILQGLVTKPMGLKLEIGKEFQSNKDHKGGIGVLMNTPTIIELQENSQRILPCSNPKFPVKCIKYKNKFWI